MRWMCLAGGLGLTAALGCTGGMMGGSVASRPASDLLEHPDVVEPLVPFPVHYTGDDPVGCVVSIDRQEVALGEDGRATFRLSGPEGLRTIRVRRDGELRAGKPIRLVAHTRLDVPAWGDLFDVLQEQVSRHRRQWRRGDRTFHMNHPWLRDNIHEMKAYKFWDDDLAGFVDMFLDLQHEDGFFYEIIGRVDHDHLPLVDDKHKRIEPEHGMSFMRLEIEADIEYLMVEAAYALWQATGDMTAMRRRLPALDRALTYMMTDPTRWNAEHGAVMRTFTIDTWDFTYGEPTDNRRIQPHMPMGIMHGDNSGLYQACRQLATMYRAAGQADAGDRWDQTAADLRERINALCFNGRYYTHQIFLAPIDTGVREEDILSLSNTYDINRGLPTHEMAVRIIDEYQQRRALHGDAVFAEWYAIDPAYPKFAHYGPGDYINGGIAPFVGGELAKAALAHGREAYGADILHRLARMVERDGAIYFLYTRDGKDQGGGPSGWGAAAVLSAVFEGLAGIRDDATCFSNVTISPRFAAGGIDQAHVCTRYGPSGAYVALAWKHDTTAGCIEIQLAGVAESTRVRILLPDNATAPELLEPAGITTWIETVESSRYLVFNLPDPLREGVANLRVAWH